MSYQTWLVLENSDSALANILAIELGGVGNIDRSRRPDLSLEKRYIDEARADFAVLSGDKADINSLFERVTGNKLFKQGAPVIAVSLAPHDDVSFFDGKAFVYDGGEFVLNCIESSADFPFAGRFVKISYGTDGVVSSVGAENTKIQYKPQPSGFPLWIEPISLELTDQQTARLFDPRPGGISDVTRAVFLPPTRTKHHPEVAQSYFNEDLVKLRIALKKQFARAGLASPVAFDLVDVVDRPELRDVFLDGGGIAVKDAKGQATTADLQIRSGLNPGSSYRMRMLCDPELMRGPKWASKLARAVQSDITALLPRNSEISKANSEAALNWKVSALSNPDRRGAEGGTWDRFIALRNRLRDRYFDQLLTFDKKITNESRRLIMKDGDQEIVEPPDNDLANKLFVHNAWRCPWSDDPSEGTWLAAMIDVLRNEFAGKTISPEERVKSWNTRELTLFCPTQREGSPLTVRYSGSPSKEEVLKWRLLLPFGSIVDAQVLCLNTPDRSMLDFGFVLA